MLGGLGDAAPQRDPNYIPVSTEEQQLLNGCLDGGDPEQLRTVQGLLEAGANARVKNPFGWEPIHLAALKGHVEVIELLLQHGASANARAGNQRLTPLCIAATTNHA
ncbi:hypothetical protein WJX72_007183 [[Myrmecia] bisecta]|uniref:Uncharacterized protein n=1 Tax=[Myrmecia] bisecta TaxID=41462 RepID=A0AAW1PLL6_9CHLO